MTPNIDCLCPCCFCILPVSCVTDSYSFEMQDGFGSFSTLPSLAVLQEEIL